MTPRIREFDDFDREGLIKAKDFISSEGQNRPLIVDEFDNVDLWLIADKNGIEAAFPDFSSILIKDSENWNQEVAKALLEEIVTKISDCETEKAVARLLEKSYEFVPILL